MEAGNAKTIIHFVHWPKSGITTLINSICERVSEYDFKTILLSGDANEDPMLRGREHFNLSTKGSLIQAIKSLRELDLDSSNSVVHCHSLMPLLLTGTFLGNTKVIYHCHCLYPWLMNTSLKSILKRLLLRYFIKKTGATTVTVSSEISVVFFEKFGIESTYIPNGIEDKGAVRSSFSSQPLDQVRFYSVTRLDPEKNILSAVNTIHELSKLDTSKDYQYHIYGSGAMEHRIRDHVNLLGLTNIKLMGFNSSPENLPQQYDFYISMSTQEGLSLSALQALRGKTPLITTRVGQIGIDLKDGINGIVIPNEPSDAAYIIFRTTKKDTKVLDKIQNSAHRYFVENYTEDKFIENTRNMYSNIVNGNIC